LRDLTQHLTARADDSHAAPLQRLRREDPFQGRSTALQARVRFFALHRIKPHDPPLVRAPVISFEFQPCDRTPQVACLTGYLRHLELLPNTKHASFRAWTTRVSNPVRSPRFRASASVMSQMTAFATGIPPDIYAFHRYTRNSIILSHTQDLPYQRQFHG
jgi:hypothetical protein